MPSFTGRQTVNWSAQLWDRPQLNYTCNSEAVDTYWNHNTAYHPWILLQAASCAARDAVDVGCGEGLLVERLAGVGINVVGLEPDPAAATRARLRLADQPRAQVLQLDFVSFQPSEQSYDLVTFVASLHHLDA
ncbi:class I SAM-dependent methyltransferase [Buchananella hordeovulneris]|nr:class I SAM-dependent methyltransferase [Buchananella hordeovulneris]